MLFFEQGADELEISGPATAGMRNQTERTPALAIERLLSTVCGTSRAGVGMARLANKRCARFYCCCFCCVPPSLTGVQDVAKSGMARASSIPTANANNKKVSSHA
eukprot:356777-Chlamydomonas_euryale.AAC.5